jgi:predicted TIM-barrel fold metal-dependent hydrolase
MRLIAIEEHFQASALRRLAQPSGFDRAMGVDNPMAKRLAKLDDVGAGRLADMDAAGIDFQVLSQTVGPMPDADAATELAREANDELAKAIAAYPDRFAGFALLPMADPLAAAAELERAVRELGFKGALVNGTEHGRFLDDRFFWPVFESAEELGVPIYLHPAEPPDAVWCAYYAGLPPATAQMLATAGWGWHVETGLHSLRLILSGVFDQFPGLNLIIGHMGEALPFMLARSSHNLTAVSGLKRPVEDYFLENFHITTSGMFAYPPLLCLLLVVGADRVIFSVDYPYSTNEEARAFIDGAPISPADKEKIAHGNVERLLGL